MAIFSEIFMALLAAFGILALLWNLWGRLLRPDLAEKQYLLLPVTGAGETLEETLRYYGWHCRSGLLHCEIIVTDMGLTAAGQEFCRGVCRREQIRFEVNPWGR
ncbi:MAG: hypothetical protein RR450_06760 [Oscillospiraceae bacterium]